ncbi:thiamine phosphate synthase [Paucibacter sp. R3-3]|uniref:Thiamine phosphate synthase n=1 Tax=Roseateles agri TaxID=3098619 RepID=A0ABU5D9V8_9BURK|nr:thiamine phosphate synthase [Paucibacter sp. R3-3]MDY0742929.1 thiamine phosphate synthase [Paucibacter sp. R3-3]
MTQDPTLVISYAEASRRFGPAPAPLLARSLRGRAGAVCLTDCPGGEDLVLDWLDSPLARGLIASHPAAGELAPRVEAAQALGFVVPDAVILARTQLAGAMPVMGFDDEDAAPDPVTLSRWQRVLHERGRPGEALGLYAICASAEDVGRWAARGVAEIQLRIKSPSGDIEVEIAAALRAVAGTRSRLWINDHWQAALQAGARALHLGQEDWARLLPAQRQALLAGEDIALGLSSHSLWELARARGLAPTYIACGPIHPTTTKDMPWRPQGLHNLAWWVAHAGRPVVAIGGLLTPAQVRSCAATGAAAACLVRALDGPVPLAEFEQAWQDGRRQPPPAPAMGPRPSLAGP